MGDTRIRGEFDHHSSDCVRKNPMKTRLSAAIMLIAGIIGMLIGKFAVQSYFDHQRASAFDRTLVETSKQLNANLPMRVDKYTQLDSTTPGPGNRFTYFYTISDVSS